MATQSKSKSIHQLQYTHKLFNLTYSFLTSKHIALGNLLITYITLQLGIKYRKIYEYFKDFRFPIFANKRQELLSMSFQNDLSMTALVMLDFKREINIYTFWISTWSSQLKKIVATAKEVGVLPPEAPQQPRHVPGVVPIMFRGMSGGFTDDRRRRRTTTTKAAY